MCDFQGLPLFSCVTRIQTKGKNKKLMQTTRKQARGQDRQQTQITIIYPRVREGNGPDSRFQARGQGRQQPLIPGYRPEVRVGSIHIHQARGQGAEQAWQTRVVWQPAESCAAHIGHVPSGGEPLWFTWVQHGYNSQSKTQKCTWVHAIKAEVALECGW